MTSRLCFCALASLGLIYIFPTSVCGQLLLRDDFDDNSLDAAKWIADTSVLTASDVVEQNGRIEITTFGVLRTVNEFDGGSLGQGIRLEADSTFGNFSVSAPSLHLRSDGNTDTTTGGSPEDGLAFDIALPDFARVIERNGGVTTDLFVVSLGLNAAIGDTIRWEVTDNGTDWAWSMTNLSNSLTFHLSGTSTAGDGTNFVSFSGGNGTGRTDFWDNISITQVPEPSSLFLTVIAGLLTLRRRNKTQ